MVLTYAQDCPAVDLVVRTSGESRLSDFLLLQSSTACLHFADALWPDMSFLDMLDAFASFQRMAPALASLRAIRPDIDPAHLGNACSEIGARCDKEDHIEGACICTWAGEDVACDCQQTCMGGPLLTGCSCYTRDDVLHREPFIVAV